MAAQDGGQAAARRGRYHHGNLRAALVDAAVAVMDRDGIEGLSLRAVARQAGVSQAAPYAHFADKAALLAAVAETGFRQFVAGNEALAAGAADAAGRVLRLGQGYVRFAVSNTAMFRLMFGPTLGDAGRRHPDLDAAGAAAWTQIATAVAAWAEQAGIPAGEHHRIAVACWCAAHGLASLLVDGRLSPEVVGAPDAEAMAERLLGGMLLDEGRRSEDADPGNRN